MIVIPANAGIQRQLEKSLDSGVRGMTGMRRNDEPHRDNEVMIVIPAGACPGKG